MCKWQRSTLQTLPLHTTVSIIPSQWLNSLAHQITICAHVYRNDATVPKNLVIITVNAGFSRRSLGIRDMGGHKDPGAIISLPGNSGSDIGQL